MSSNDVANKEFAIVLRGYSREAVRFYLLELARQLAERDGRINRLEAELAHARAELGTAENLGRLGLLRHLGVETAAILEAADASAVRMRADAEAAAVRVREGLRTIGGRLADVHQLMGELVGIVQGIGDQPAPPTPPSPVTPVDDGGRWHAAAPRFTGGHDVEILLPDDNGAPRFL